MSDELILDEVTFRVWQELKRAGVLQVGELVERIGFDQAQITAVATTGAEQGYIEIEETEREEVSPSEQAGRLLEQALPERRAAQKVREAGGELAIGDLVSWSKENGIAVNEVFKWGGARGWLERVKGDSGVKLVLTPEGSEALQAGPADDEKAVERALESTLYLDQLAEDQIDPDRVRKLLANRSELAKIRTRTERTLKLTKKALVLLESGQVKALRERNLLSSEDIESGAWREIMLRPYDVTLPARTVFAAKIHPMRKIMEETRRAFLEMGFTEVASPMVESAFWNFDALYQPQDHPARDMQDTFYMAQPAEVELPDAKVFEPVRQTHQDGWKTGSDGWGYRFRERESRRVVLRTHTTAATIRALAAHPDPPGKFFCVGWNYRNENISFKHLPVFHQVDGIVVDRDASLATLLGTLEVFYRKMGFPRVKFKPAFYPYTEPSVDVVAYMASRGDWIEMGGSGVFRPEVTEPLGCHHPVLAWGLGLERLAMLRYGFHDIRELYRSNLDSLQRVALCR